MCSISNLPKPQLSASLPLNIDETGFFFTLQNRFLPRLEVSSATGQVLQRCKGNESEINKIKKKNSAGVS